MYRVIAGATGLIGKRLVEDWLLQKHNITVIGRSQQRIEKCFGNRVQAVTWDKLTRDVLQSAELVVNLTGENVGAKRWSPALKKEMINSRVGSTKMLAGLLAELGEKSPPLFNASAIGIYGLQEQLANKLPPSLDENTPIDWENPPDFLSSVARRWEKAATVAETRGVRIVFLRFAVVLAKEGGALPMIAKPFQYFFGGPVGSGQQPFSWIAIDDVIAAIDFLAAKPEASGPYNIVAPECVPQYMLARAVATALNRPDAVKMPPFVLNLMLGKEMARELLLEGQHVYPQRLLELGFKFTYPDINVAINHLLR